MATSTVKETAGARHDRVGWAGRMRAPLILGVLTACVLTSANVAHVPRLKAQTARPIVYVIAIEGMIDLGLAPFLSRTIREAREAGAAAVLLDINTFGGRVDAAVAMRDTLLNAPVRTIAFVNQRAISAGALIALACDTLIMAKGGTIGAAAPVRRRRHRRDAAGGRKVGLLRPEGISRHGGGPQSRRRRLPKRWWTPMWRLRA